MPVSLVHNSCLSLHNSPHNPSNTHAQRRSRVEQYTLHGVGFDALLCLCSGELRVMMLHGFQLTGCKVTEQKKQPFTGKRKQAVKSAISKTVTAAGSNLQFNHNQDESNIDLYRRGQQFVGAIQARNRRYIELAELLSNLKQGQHVQNRSLQTHLTSSEYDAMLAEWARQQLIRSGSKHKPEAIKRYEEELNRVQLQHIKAEDLAQRGHDDSAAAMTKLCSSQLTVLLHQLAADLAVDGTLEQWLDRPIPIAQTLIVHHMPRAITSASKDSQVQRKTKADVKIAAVKSAMWALEQLLD